MNKDYFKWLRELQRDSLYIRYGTGDFRFHRKHFLAGWTPSDSACMCVPF
jgi:hypothetical protein